MQAKQEKGRFQHYSQFMEQLELRNGKGIPIHQIPCTYAIAHQNRCLIFGFLTLCPVKCPKFRIGEPISEQNDLINTWCKFLEKLDVEYYCSVKGHLSDQTSCQACQIYLETKLDDLSPNNQIHSVRNILKKIRR
ncbi:MAG: hypothetical protein ACFFBD_10550 [Candidatus Hodarchaeota archaeon]